jgi:pheromone shutdown protein TraB
LLFWVLANGIPCALGALVALAHPLTILAAFVAAPITSLSPLIGAGYVTAFVEAYFARPWCENFRPLPMTFINRASGGRTVCYASF